MKREVILIMLEGTLFLISVSWGHFLQHQRADST